MANGLVDAATNNTTGLAFYRTGTPEAQAAVAKTKVIWTPPDLPESAMVYRKDSTRRAGQDPRLLPDLRQRRRAAGRARARRAQDAQAAASKRRITTTSSPWSRCATYRRPRPPPPNNHDRRRRRLLKPPVQPLAQRLTNLALFGALAVVLASSVQSVELKRLALVFTNSGNMSQLGAAFIHPDFSLWKLYVAQMWLTVQIAMWGTFLAVVYAVLLACSAPRTSRRSGFSSDAAADGHPAFDSGSGHRHAVHRRGGPGPLRRGDGDHDQHRRRAGQAVRGRGIHRPRPCSRAFAPPAAAPLQEIVWGVIPQVAPLWTSYALYRFESNSRSATVLGLISAGGIGQASPSRSSELAAGVVDATEFLVSFRALVDLAVHDLVAVVAGAELEQARHIAASRHTCRPPRQCIPCASYRPTPWRRNGRRQRRLSPRM